MRFPRFPLFVPAHRTDRYSKAAASGADVVILDLEDAVAPADKARARDGVVARSDLGVPVVVRINAEDSAWFDHDLQALAQRPPQAIMVPKAASAQGLERVRAAVGSSVALLPLIESVKGLSSLPDLLQVDGVCGVAFGHLDFAVDLGCSPDWESLLLVRSTVVLQCRAAGRPAPLDGVTVNVTDPEATRADAARAKALGFGGKLLIHPSQVAPAKAAMEPSAAERSWAASVLAASQDGGAAKLDGEMIDAPVLARARAILAE